MANVTGLEDRGNMWRILFDDGGYDEIPKDINKLIDGLVAAQKAGQTKVAAEIQDYINNIKAYGQPVPPTVAKPAANWMPWAVAGGLVVISGVAIYLLSKPVSR